MVPYEAFLAEKPVVTTTDAGGPLEVVADRATGLVCEPRRGRARRGVRVARASTSTTRARGARPAGASRERVSWDRAIDRLLA